VVAPEDAIVSPDKPEGSVSTEPGESPPRRTSGVRPGGRSERVVREILEAAAVELGRSGYAKFAIDDVASRAGVAKTTIYRRWPTKAALVTAALRALRHDGADVDGDGTKEAALREVDTGSVRSDLLELLHANTTLTATAIGMSIARMLTAELGNPEVEAIARELRAEHRAPFLVAIERGVARGELVPSTDPALVAEVLAAAVVMRGYKLREPVNEAYLEKLVDLVLNGVARSRA
jgi:AcrR family transcriptional regulator